jgi:hypothetical protein
VGLLVVGLILVAVAAAPLYAGIRSKRRLTQMKGTATSTCADVIAMFAGVATELGPDALKQAVELKGKAAHPQGQTLTSALGGTDCVWYRATVTERYRVYEEQGTGEQRHRQLVDKERTLSDETSKDVFAVDDGTGAVLIDAQSVHVDHPIATLDRTVVDDDGGWIGRFDLNVNLGGLVLGNTGEGTVNFRHQEWLLPVGQALYVSGEAGQDGGAVRITKPEHGTLLVSTRSEEALVTSSTRGAVGFQLAAAGVAVLGVVLAVVGLVSLAS